MTVLLGLALEPTTALAARDSSRAHPTSSGVTHNASSHPKRISGRPDTAVVPVGPGAGDDRAGGSPRVRALQRLLVRAGDDPGPIDGRYGPLTQQAVQRYQAAHGLQVDGIAGPRTVAALTAPTPVLFPTAGDDRTRGSLPVRTLQRLLLRAGDKPGPIDGRYGPLTERAVQRYQAAHGLKVDGIAGPQTFTQLTLRAAAHPRTPASTHPRSRPLSTPSQPQPHPPVSAPAPTSAGHTHPARTPSRWLALLGLLALGLLLAYVRRRSAIGHKIETSPQTVQATQLDPPAGRRSATEGNLVSREVAWSHAGQRDGPRENGDHDVSMEAAFRRADQRGDARGAMNLGRLLESRNDLAGAEAAYRRAMQRGADQAQLARGALAELEGRLQTPAGDGER